ncbi:MAG: aminotransferase [Lentisphaeria bacterium]|nr:aminotransferase [Lentisphaeria bacterium]
MDNYSEQSAERLAEIQADLERQYAGYQARNLKLDMSRGKPSGSQLDLTNGILDRLDGYMVEGGIDARNYGCLEGIHEARKLFSELLGIPRDRLMIGGNSSLNMMYDTIVRHWVFGTHGHTPWGRLPAVKFLCPCPGYDRHFAICEDLGIEMIPVPMTANGPDMDMVEQIAGSDDAVKGIWCVPLYSNPQGVCYSDETVDRLASMRTAAPDFRIFWDNAYGVHHIYEECRLKDIFASAEAAGNPERVYYFFSTSKITFPGAGVALLATGPGNFTELRHHMSIQTIGPDKLNQLRTVRYLKSAEGVREHMRVLARELRPKFDLVLDTLERELGGTGLASWMRPKGGYFIALDTIPGCAKAVIELAKNAGVKLTGAGSTFPLHHDPLDRNIRIAPTYPPLDELKTAIELFCVCVKLAGVRKLLADKKA